MSLILADRVQETTSTTGSGSFSLAGAVNAYQTFRSGVGNGNSCFYGAINAADGEWEVGSGTLTSGSPDVLSRTTVISSSNANAKVSFTHSPIVFCTAPAIYLNPANVNITGGTIAGVDGSGILQIPYDVAFIAGLQSDGTFANLAVQTYGELVIARALTIVGEQLYMDTAPTGAAAIFDIMKNGTSCYTTIKPQCAISANSGTAGVLTTTTFAAGDRVTFKCTQKGSTITGAGVRFTLKCKLA